MTTPSPDIVSVALGARSYNVHIGHGVRYELAAALKSHNIHTTVGLISDETVAQHHAKDMENHLRDAGFSPVLVTVPAGESSKSWASLQHVVESLLQARLERRSALIALGGGVIGDLAGLAASLLKRGMPCFQCPTSLLAQVDSSVGGKTGINSVAGKNLIGTFHQPTHVLADLDWLATLSERHKRAGYAEIIKGALITSAAAVQERFAQEEALWKDQARLQAAISTAIRIKAGIVERDETEQGERALLNLGHTFGHALEAIANYDDAKIIHGEGVAIGLVWASAFALARGDVNESEHQRLVQHLKAVGLPTHPSETGLRLTKEDAPALLNWMQQDKKVVGEALTLILPKGLGQAAIHRDVPKVEVLAFLQNIL